MRSFSSFILSLVFTTSLFVSPGTSPIPTSERLKPHPFGSPLPAPETRAAESIIASGLNEVTLFWGEKTSQTLQLTNTGPTAAAFTITEESELAPSPAATIPRILVVNDGGNDNLFSFRAFNTALANLGYAFDQVTSNALTGIPATLTDYDLVIYAGVPSIVNSTPGQEILELRNYLNAGGRLILADNDFGYLDGSTAFYTEYFQAAYGTDNGSKGVLTGVDIMQGINPSILSDPYPDSFSLNGAEAVGIFQNASAQWAGLRIARNSYRAIYLAWDFHFTGTSLVGEPVETEILAAALQWILADIGLDEVAWLRELPTTGSIASGGSQGITIGYDSGVPEIAQPSTYSAALSISESQEDAPVRVPIVMHVQPAQYHGLIRGRITGTGYCDGEAIPLEGANVSIQNSAGFTVTLKTDATGAFEYWVDARASPYSIQVSATGHLTRSTTAAISGRQTLTKDIALRWDAPCISMSAQALSVTASMFSTTTVPLTITNQGATPSTFEIREAQDASPSGTPLDVLWLSETPSRGTLAPENGRQRVEITFHTSMFNQPGVYQAGLHVVTQDPFHPMVFVPVTLNLQAPGTWGKVTGVVSGLGECDAHSQPLSGAQVLIEDTAGITRTIETDEMGQYEFWTEAGTYSAVVSAGGHLDRQVEGIVIEPGLATRRDISLRADAPCAALTPSYLTVDLVLGQQSSLPITLINQGALTANFEIIASETNPSGLSSWLSVLPETGHLPPDGGFATGTVTFDASQVPAPGVYKGVLQLLSNNPISSRIDYPVQMTAAAPAFGVKLSAPVSAQSASPGANIRYEVEIENLGNLTDTFHLAVAGNLWPTNLPVSVILKPGGTQTVEVQVNVPEHALPGASDTVTIHAVSQAKPEKSASAELVTTVLRRCGVSLTPTAAALTGSPGQKVEYLLRLKNTGEATDSYTLTVKSSLWMVELPASVSDVGTGATVEVSVLVTIPTTAKPGDREVVTVTAASTGEDQARAAAVLTTSAGPPIQSKIFLPLARK